jgi:hypothetical protein
VTTFPTFEEAFDRDEATRTVPTNVSRVTGRKTRASTNQEARQSNENVEEDDSLESQCEFDKKQGGLDRDLKKSIVRRKWTLDSATEEPIIIEID